MTKITYRWPPVDGEGEPLSEVWTPCAHFEVEISKTCLYLEGTARAIRIPLGGTLELEAFAGEGCR